MTALREMLKIHYRNLHGTTNLPWQKAFRKYGELSLGPVTTGGFPEEIDHLHLGGSCKGALTVRPNPIMVAEIKNVQARTGCDVSVFFGDPQQERFKFHHDLLDADIPKLRIYSTAMYGTPMWRSEVTWVAQPTDENIFRLVKHKENGAVLFVGGMTSYREKVIAALRTAGIEVEIVNNKYGKDLVEFSKNYMMSIGMVLNEGLSKFRYSSVRLPNALAMGLIHIEADFDLRGVYERNEIIQWKGINDLIDKIKYYQKYPAEGYEIMMRGRKKVLDNWTFDGLAKKFIRGT